MSRRLVHFVQQTGIVRFMLLFEQYCVKILITSFWDTQYFVKLFHESNVLQIFAVIVTCIRSVTVQLWIFDQVVYSPATSEVFFFKQNKTKTNKQTDK